MLRDRIIWLHVDLPGQEANAADLGIHKYPTLPDLAQELSLVLDHFKVNQVVVLGEGLGANLAARFAIHYPNLVQGIALIHPTGSTASFMESVKDKLVNLLPHKSNHLSDASEAYLLWHRYGKVI